jgi:hypothetical protein
MRGTLPSEAPARYGVAGGNRSRPSDRLDAVGRFAASHEMVILRADVAYREAKRAERILRNRLIGS